MSGSEFQKHKEDAAAIMRAKQAAGGFLPQPPQQRIATDVSYSGGEEASRRSEEVVHIPKIIAFRP